VLGVLQGFATLAFVVAVGWLLARFRVVGAEAQRVLSLVAFWVCSPALLLAVMQRTPLDQVFSVNLAVTTIAVAVTGGLALVAFAFCWPQADAGTRVMAALCASYVNAGNLGIPIALYVLGDVAWMAPVLLLQLLVITPIVMTILDRSVARSRPSWGRSLVSLVRNPITLGAVGGLLLALTGLRLPPVLADPVDLLGGMAVPAMLLAFGISLQTGPHAGAGGSMPQVAALVALKLVVMPLVALAVGAVGFGLDGPTLFAVVVTSALPAAQNIFTYAVRYDRAVALTRDAIFFSTFGSLAVILLVAAAFHAAGWV